MKLGYNEATGMGCSTLEADLFLCEAVGFDYIEIRFDMLRCYLSDHRLEDLRDQFRKLRLKPHGLNALYIYNEMLSGSKNPDPAREKEVMDDFFLGCQTGEMIGSHNMVVVPDLYREAPNTRPYLEPRENIFLDSVRILRALADLAAPSDMKLAFEPVGSPGSAVKTVEQAWEIVQGVNRENVGLALDCFNLHLCGKLNDFSSIRKIPPEKIFAVHINNVDHVSPDVMGNAHRRLCGPGAIDLENYLGNLRAAGYGGMVSIETFRPEYWAMNNEALIREAFKTTKAVVERYGL